MTLSLGLASRRLKFKEAWPCFVDSHWKEELDELLLLSSLIFHIHLEYGKAESRFKHERALRCNSLV